MRHLFTGVTLAALVATATALPVVAAHGAGTPVDPPTMTAPGQQASAAVTAEQARADQAGVALGLGRGEKLVVKDVITDADGSSHVRYQRTFDGLRVIGGDLVSHRDSAGAVRDVTWNASGKAAVASTTPTLAASSAVAKAAPQGVQASGAPRGELVVYAGGAAPVLAYDVLTEGVKADQTPSRYHSIVDASSGALLTGWDEVVEGTGNSIYAGTVTVNTILSGSTWQLKDSHGNYATDMNQKTGGNGTTFTDADNVWGNGATSNRQSAAVDAHYGAGKTYDFFNNVLGRAGIWNNGTGARSRVHYGNSYVNAFWDGTQMTYGDGAGNAKPLVSLDVAGHEMTHGVTERTAGLVYNGDAGGLNEATSDIFGTSVEFYAANSSDPGDYLIGEKININGNGTPLRYMDKPSKDGKSQDCWSVLTATLDPHYSSGPLNHWFYMLSEGTGTKVIGGVTHSSTACNGSTITGIGRAAAQKIWYRALSVYLTSTSTYGQARTAALNAARDLYGTGSTQYNATAAAFSGISVS